MKHYEALTIDAVPSGVRVASTSTAVFEWIQAYMKRRVPGCTARSGVSYAIGFSGLKDMDVQVASELFGELCHQGWKPVEWTYSGRHGFFRLLWEGESE